jgi:hypothetical protein
MKKATGILFLIVFGFSFSSCVKVNEDLTGQPTSDKFFQTITDFQSYIAGAYSPLFHDNFTFDGDYAFICEAGAEDIDHHITRWKGFEELNINEVSNPDEITNPLWNGSYSSISIANTLLGIADTSSISKELIDPVVGEAKFLRGLNYFFLVRWFGQVPILTDSNTLQATTLEQSSVENIYNFIVNDLKDAQNRLPQVQTDPSKPTKGAAAALLAKVYLFMAGFPLNQTDKYALAQAQAQQVMDMAAYQLDPNFSDIMNWDNRKTNPEFIFTLYANSQSGSGTNVHMCSRPATNGEGGWGDWATDSRFYQEFPAGARRDATFYTTMIDGTDWSMTNYGNPFPSKYRNAGPNSNFFIGPPVSYVGDGYSPLLRYADVLLMYAEAANQAENGPSSAAYAAINQVRARAGLPDLTPGLSKDNFDQAVISERNWELAFEHNRWFDLCRKHIVKDAMQSWYPNSVIDDHNYLLPKPLIALNLMKGVHQNPGY